MLIACQLLFFSNRDNIFWVGYFAHLLHLAVKVGLLVPGINILCTKLHKLTAFFNKSTKARFVLKDASEWLDFPDLQLISEVPTRWGSFLKSGRRILEVKDAIIIALSRENSELKFIDYDWMLLEAICNDLQVFHEITTLCSANDCFTLNHVLPSINMIMTQLNSKDTLPEADCKLPIIKFRAAMQEDLEKRYQNESMKKKSYWQQQY